MLVRVLKIIFTIYYLCNLFQVKFQYLWMLQFVEERTCISVICKFAFHLVLNQCTVDLCTYEFKRVDHFFQLVEIKLYTYTYIATYIIEYQF